MHAPTIRELYGGGYYRVVIDPEGPQPGTLWLRSMGVSEGGVRRLLEVAVEHGST